MVVMVSFKKDLCFEAVHTADDSECKPYIYIIKYV